ncbi:hypothetical protein A2721_02795 [Candidatus Gottesmanbacteria bacterium RIFCSPHIGHO2_01_FULL_47_48]|uniref:4-alpha-glucanotransferase n=1 Tax=Candidatus Gottesmanbacteria bacterium RIFCSPHIGHO2_01_FULL_47_48 TaxID=1798381 RepID=A0A1F6A409_9BACT|nr:MAG: hypothetical protein A2721_02795 [Candidatus Gottesmanbacteria bacterium RIFCSPHIGHO2_01_FULL_47_48]
MAKVLGTLLPFNSLRSEKYGQDLFSSAKLFIDWLGQSGQNVWQMLPVSANTWHGREKIFLSPYYGYGIGLNPRFLPTFEREKKYPEVSREFREANEFWLPDYGLFLALSEKFGTDCWPRWPGEWRDFEEKSVAKARKELSQRIDFHEREQEYIYRKFVELRSYASEKGVEIWGDVPFFLPINSPLVWRFRECFLVSAEGAMDFVSGVPKDEYFRRQVWGHPLYRWSQGDFPEAILDVWKERLKFVAGLFDQVRLDSVIRFYVYHKLKVARSGGDEIGVGPGDLVFELLVRFARGLGLEVFGEDVSSFDMTKLRLTMRRLNIAGVSVFTMGLRRGERELNKKHFNLDLLKTNHVFYTSTHDVKPMVSFLEDLSPEQKRVVRKSLNLNCPLEPRALAGAVREKLRAESEYLLVPLPDWLLTRARINVPGTSRADNWNYVMEEPVERLTIR